ncbi:MAG: type III-A CRISPR-associated RAMP protein Csm3 [Nitrospinota bacterium]
MSNNNYKFSGKYIINADLRCVTGLHIGGTDEGFEIGGMDNPVIKDPITDYPYIPGSSLKGKMRSLLEWADAKVKFETDKKGNPAGKLCDCGVCDICIVFGCSAATSQKEPTRLTVRDSLPKDTSIKNWEANLGEKIYTEVKTENAIDRLTSEANPRSMERVPADSVFEVEMLFDLYKDDDVQKLKKIFEGMGILEDSSLGGSGSRGSGKVVFENISIIKRNLKYYTQGSNEEKVELNGSKSVRDIFNNFQNIFKDGGEKNEANKIQQS